MVPFASALVPGAIIPELTVSTQFWMDEYIGFLRIATTNRQYTNTFIDNKMYVLDYNLKIFG